MRRISMLTRREIMVEEAIMTAHVRVEEAMDAEVVDSDRRRSQWETKGEPRVSVIIASVFG